jgi:uncharacterized protein (TIGR03435 family)
VDRTGLTGTFDVDFEYFPPAQALANNHPQLAVFLGVTPIADRLVQQLGLRLEPRLVPQDVVIVERATRPQP